MNILNLKLDKEKVVIAKIKVVVLNKHGIPIWVEYKSLPDTLEEACKYYQEINPRD